MRDTLSQTFAALADPTRRAMLLQLSAGAANVSELAAPFAMSQPAISKHLQVLERAGLIRKGRDGQHRPCTLDARALREASDWMEHYRQFWEESFDRLDAYLKTVTARAKAPPAPASTRRVSSRSKNKRRPAGKKEPRHGKTPPVK